MDLQINFPMIGIEVLQISSKKSAFAFVGCSILRMAYYRAGKLWLQLNVKCFGFSQAHHLHKIKIIDMILKSDHFIKGHTCKKHDFGFVTSV